MSFGTFLGWIEGHPGLASWVQAVGAIAALMLAVLLPWLSRRNEKRDAIDARLSMFFVLLVDTESVLKRHINHDMRPTVNGLASVLARIDELLGAEKDLWIAQQALQARSVISELAAMLDHNWREILWRGKASSTFAEIKKIKALILKRRPKLFSENQNLN
jgi:hypothetical protein